MALRNSISSCWFRDIVSKRRPIGGYGFDLSWSRDVNGHVIITIHSTRYRQFSTGGPLLEQNLYV